MTPIPAVLLVVAQRLLHRGRDLDLLHISAGSLNTPITYKISKHFDAEHNVSPPSLIRLDVVTVPDPIRGYKARTQIIRVLVSQIFPDRKHY